MGFLSRNHLTLPRLEASIRENHRHERILHEGTCLEIRRSLPCVSDALHMHAQHLAGTQQFKLGGEKGHQARRDFSKSCRSRI